MKFNMIMLNLRLPHIFLISEVDTCLIMMFDHSFSSIGPALQEYGVILSLGASKTPNYGKNVSKNCQHWQFLDTFCHFKVSYRPSSGKITSYSCRAGPKLENEWSNIIIRQVSTSEMREM